MINNMSYIKEFIRKVLEMTTDSDNSTAQLEYNLTILSRASKLLPLVTIGDNSCLG